MTTDLLAALWGVDRVIVGDAVYADESGALADVWGKFVVVAYTKTGTVQDLGEPSYGYTYRLDGAPYVEQGYQTETPSPTSTRSPTRSRRKPGPRRCPATSSRQLWRNGQDDDIPKVVEPLRHDGEDFPVGAEVALDKADAAALLLARGIIAEARPEAKEA